MILKYNASNDQKQKDEIYKQYIDKAFTKIATSLIYKYKIQSRIKNSQTIIQECVSDMIQRAPKFDPQRGKAFTFFTILARNFILTRLNKIIEHNQKFKSINNINVDGEEVNLLQQCSKLNWQHLKQDKYSQIVLQNTMKQLVKYIQQEYIPFKTKKLYQQEIAQAIVRLIKDIDFINNFNKKAVMLYINQMTGYNSYKINKVLKDISKKYYEIKQNVIQTQIDLLQYQY